MPLTPTTRLGPYEIIAPLGAGGMGEVYRARDTRLGRDVAVKVLPADVANSPDRLARFEREARTLAALNHPNIVVLHSIENAGGVQFLTMELLDGETLDRQMTSGGLPVARVLEIGIAVADALTAAHERGIVHRDLKPANVMLTKVGRIKVLDFGLARPAAPAAGSDLSRAATVASPISSAGLVMGTVPYMAPEQVRGESVDARTDLFALGIVLYELATGQRPFTGDTHADISSAILRDQASPLRSLRPDLPADLERIVGRCLDKEPRARFQTALDVLNELRALQHTTEHGALPTPKLIADNVASIAVLAFVNRSASTDDEYFSDGLADELLNLLARIRGLRVAARTSSFHFKGKDTTIAEIGRALNVETILEGSVRKAGRRVRISVQLIKVADGYHLWSETYDRTLDDIFAVQDDIAQSVVSELRTTLLGEEPDSQASDEVRSDVARAAKGRGTSPEAHRLYLQAKYLMERNSRPAMARAVEYLKQALDLEPGFALGWAKLALAYEREADNCWVPLADGYRRSREAVNRALALEPDLAEGHAVIAGIQMAYEHDWRAAGASVRRALELAPGNVLVLRRAGVLGMTEGRLEDTIDLYRRALEQDPLSAGTYHNLAMVLHAAGRLDEAEAACRKGLELTPQRTATRARLALVLLALGRNGEAAMTVADEPDEAFRLWALTIMQHVLGCAEQSAHALRDLIEAYADDSAYQIAEACGARGEADPAFRWLERAYAQRDGGLLDLKTSPYFRSLHGDPRWNAFLKKMGFEE